ncbi:hypothetical protein Pa4123_61640 [Phytohabitans aurantiacus]|uniref:Tetratricopeptide repeat protein n=1 Tax=Phytohabitans aurantiacus TaxID=3016789 RepID=A0ABQ5R3U5_9ACTN|nr:hypothetical protein Pa4123_61640 [Phytohabitans aurantiacus]
MLPAALTTPQPPQAHGRAYGRPSPGPGPVPRHRRSGRPGRILNNIGWYHTLRGDHATAIIHCRHALGLHQKTGDRRGEVAGDHDTARDNWRQALTILDELSHPDAHQLHAMPPSSARRAAV